MPVEVKGLEKRFGEFGVRVDLRVEDDEILVLAGPSGCGKTTALQMIAGLLAPDSGSVEIDGEDVGALPAWKRRIGVVFQDLALFPHLDVGRNVSYGPEVAGIGPKERRRRVERYLAAVRLEGYERRRVDTLSGGERQRVAIARSLAASPRALLMDEPFSSLDAPLRRELRGEFRDLRRREGFPCLFVTHDRDEAAALADRIAVMRDGRIVEIGTPRTLFLEPRSAFVANFLGAGTVLPLASVERRADGSARVASDLGSWMIDDAPEGPLALLVPPDAARVCSDGEWGTKTAATVSEVIFEGDRATIAVALVSGARLAVHQSPRRAIPTAGELVYIDADLSRVRAVVDDLT